MTNDEKHKFYNIKNGNEVYHFDERISLEEVVEQLNHFMDLKYNYSYSELLKELDELKTEDSRLCNIISGLHNDIGDYKNKIKRQDTVINIQWDIITSLMELKGWWNDCDGI